MVRGSEYHQAVTLLHHGLRAQRLLFLLLDAQFLLLLLLVVFSGALRVRQIGLGALGSQALRGWLFGVGEFEG